MTSSENITSQKAEDISVLLFKTCCRWLSQPMIQLFKKLHQPPLFSLSSPLLLIWRHQGLQMCFACVPPTTAANFRSNQLLIVNQEQTQNPVIGEEIQPCSPENRKGHKWWGSGLLSEDKTRDILQILPTEKAFWKTLFALLGPSLNSAWCYVDSQKQPGSPQKIPMTFFLPKSLPADSQFFHLSSSSSCF